MRTGYNVAIDGPAGAGKSTIARRIAKKMNFIYVDTGAMYRAMALYLLRKGVAPTDAGRIADACGEADISIEYRDGEQVVLLNGENVNAYLRTEEVSSMASYSSAVPEYPQKAGFLTSGAWTGCTTSSTTIRRRRLSATAFISGIRRNSTGSTRAG